jgi:hypothetical protein
MFIINILLGYHGHLNNDRADGLLGGFLIYPKDRTTPLLDGTRIMTEREYYMILQGGHNCWDLPNFGVMRQKKFDETNYY